MAEDTATAGQPTAVETEAGGEQESSTPYVPSFLRDEEGEAEPTTEETPETQTEEGEAEPQTEEETSEETPETTGEETAESIDDFIGQLTLKDRAYYAKRYPTAWKTITDPSQPDDMRALLCDKIKGDFDIQERIRSQQEPTLAEEEEEAAPVTTPDAAETRKQYYAQIDEIVSKQIDPQAVNELGSNLLSAMGVDLKSEDPDIKAIVQNAPRVGQVLAKGALDLISTTLPGILMSRMEVAMPGISEMYHDNLRARTWEQIRSKAVKGSDGVVSKPYAKLPQMGTPQWDAAVDKVLAEMPELREMYSNLPTHERFAKQFTIAAKLMSGQQVSPAMVAQAVETGKKLARTAVTRRAAGKVLGAGKPTGEARGSANGNEDIFGPGIEEYKRRGG